MSNELCFCLWYYLSSRQKLIGISSRGYVLFGDDERKGELLAALAGSDYLTQDRRPLAPRLTKAFPDGVPYGVIARFGVEDVFSEEFTRIAGQMPPQLPVPEYRCFYAQPMYDFGYGFVPCEIGDGYVKELSD